MSLVPAKESTTQPQREPSLNHPQNDGDDVVMVDSIRQSPGKRKRESDQSDPRPEKRQTFWVEVPPRRKKVLSVSVKREQSSPEVVIEAEDATSTLTPKQEPDQELANTLALIKNVSGILNRPFRRS